MAWGGYPLPYPNGGPPALGGFAWPRSAAEMAAVMGGGSWQSGWALEESSGNLADAFGSLPLTPTGTPRYREAGAFAGDRAVGFDDNTSDGFNPGNTVAFDLDASTSMAVYVCGRYDGTPSNRFLVSKIGFGDGWGVLAPGGDGQLWAYLDGAIGSAASEATGDHRGQWFDLLMCIDRVAQRLQIITNLGAGPARDISAVTTSTNAVAFALGATPGGTTCGWSCAFAAIATGTGVNELRTNATTVIANIRRATGR